MVVKTRAYNVRVLREDIARLLLFSSYIIPFIGLIVKPIVVWPLTFGLVILWIALGRYEANGALSMIWGVQVEPAPCDALFLYSWTKRLVSGKLIWPAFVELHMLSFFVLLDILQLFWVHDLKRGLWFTGATAYTISLSFLFSNAIKTAEAFKVIRRHYLATVIVTAGILLLLAVLNVAGLADNLTQLYYAGRPKGFFKDPNVAGPFVATGALFALSQLVFLRVRLVGKHGLLFLVFAAAVAVTFSRGAFLNLLVGIVVLGVFASWCHKGLRFVAISVPIILIMAFVLSCTLGIFGQAWRFYGLPAYDIYGRFSAWRAGLQIFMQNPWGIGPGQFEIVSPAYERALSTKELILTPSAHSTYLRVLTENGALGFALLVGALLGLLWRSVKSFLIAREREAVATVAWLGSCFVGILAESFVIDTLHWRHLWILVGFIIAYRRLLSKPAIMDGR